MNIQLTSGERHAIQHYPETLHAHAALDKDSSGAVEKGCFNLANE
jgi:hypothetical protein